MLTMDQLQTVAGVDALDEQGDKIGSVGQIYLDDSSGQPEWVTIKTGMFGTKESFVPVEAASLQGDSTLRIPFDKEKVKGAPKVEADQHLDPAQERELYRYYGLDYDDGAVGGPGHDTSGPNTDDAMTRSEERMHVGTESETTGRARLRKYVVTEHQNVSVPVSHEEAVVEREPITDTNRDEAMAGPGFNEEEHEVTLNAERPTVSKEEVPVERVRLGKETVSGEEQVEDDVRKEQVEAEGDLRDEGRR